jgi:hypothetical protein
MVLTDLVLPCWSLQSITKKLSEDPTLKHRVAEVVKPTAVQSSRSEAAAGRRGNNIFF